MPLAPAAANAMPRESAAPVAPVRTPEPYTTMGDIGSTYSGATLKRPNSIMPSWMTGALPHALLMSGLGGVAGHYAIPALAKWMMPELKEEKLRRISGPLGAMLGLGVAAPNLYSSFQAARGVSPDELGERGSLWDGFRGLVGGVENFPSKAENAENLRKATMKVPMVKKNAFNEGFWSTPSINPASFTNAVRSSVYHGQADPVSATQVVVAADIIFYLGNDGQQPVHG